MFLKKLIICLAAVALPATVSAQERPDFETSTATALSVGEEYIGAYIARDWDRLAPLMADDVTFQDTTAQHVFGGVKHEGKDPLLVFFRKGYSGISRMEFALDREFASSDNAIFEGTLDWDVDMGGGRIVSTSMPFVVVLTVHDGKVVSHRDYADYRPFLTANEASMIAAGEAAGRD